MTATTDTQGFSDSDLRLADLRDACGMATATRRAALCVRVSTANRGQTVENQLQPLQDAAARPGWTIVAVHRDEGISGAKGRQQRPGLDAMLRGVTRGEYDLVAAWSVCRLGRSLPDLIGLLGELQSRGVDLYLHQQALDTGTPSGRALFGMLGVFGDDAECAVMLSNPTGTQESPGLRRRCAPR